MKVTFTRTFEVEAPEGATHYCGDLVDEAVEPGIGNVVWYKYSENSTGTFKGYSVWWGEPRRGPNGERLAPGWYIYGERPPRWNFHEIPKTEKQDGAG